MVVEIVPAAEKDALGADGFGVKFIRDGRVETDGLLAYSFCGHLSGF